MPPGHSPTRPAERRPRATPGTSRPQLPDRAAACPTEPQHSEGEGFGQPHGEPSDEDIPFAERWPQATAAAGQARRSPGQTPPSRAMKLSRGRRSSGVGRSPPRILRGSTKLGFRHSVYIRMPHVVEIGHDAHGAQTPDSPVPAPIVHKLLAAPATTELVSVERWLTTTHDTRPVSRHHWACPSGAMTENCPQSSAPPTQGRWGPLIRATPALASNMRLPLLPPSARRWHRSRPAFVVGVCGPTSRSGSRGPPSPPLWSLAGVMSALPALVVSMGVESRLVISGSSDLRDHGYTAMS